MLANPIAFPAYADPLIWGIASVAMLAEVGTVQGLLRRMHQDVTGLNGPLLVINLMTWIPFLVAIDLIAPRSDTGQLLLVGGLEILIVVVEAFLIRAATAGNFLSRGLPCHLVSCRDALRLSFFGNLVSIAVSIAVPLLVFAIAR